MLAHGQKGAGFWSSLGDSGPTRNAEVLILLLQHMVRDGSPFAFIDTHAGRGHSTQVNVKSGFFMLLSAEAH